ncbi:glycosyltransferase [Eubacteriaceae bacterium ES3]|nr:glycosyltransferase [Eubacteriaceae bacterium ES3]
MNRKILKIIIVTLISLLAIVSAYKIYLIVNERDYLDHNYSAIKTLTDNQNLADYSFAVVGNAENSNDVFSKRIVESMNNDADIAFLISTGNAVLDGAEEKYRLLNKSLDNLNVPSIIGVGSNEVSDGGYVRFYNHLGPTYFSFTYNQDYFIFLDSTEATTFEVQEEWLLSELAMARDYRHRFIIMEQSPLDVTTDVVDYSGGLRQMFSENGVTGVFYSAKDYDQMTVDGVVYYASGNAGGFTDSEDYGYLKISVTENSPVADYVQVMPAYNNVFMQTYIGFWYKLHTLIYVQFFNIIIVLSVLLLSGILAYRRISRETDYYRDFSVANRGDYDDRKLSIAMFTNNYLPFIGGVPISISRLSEELRKNGHRVVIFAPNYPNSQEDESDVIRCPLLKYYKSAQIPFPIANIYSPKIEKAFKDFDLVHVHHPFWMGKKGLRLGQKANLPVVLTYHTRLEKYSQNLPFGRMMFKNFVSHHMIRVFGQQCDGIVAPTQSAKEYLENVGVSRPKLIMPTGIDLTAYHKNDLQRIAEIRANYVDEDTLLLCSVFRLSKEKNPEFLIEGIDVVRKLTTVKFKCIIIGEGPEREQITEKINELDLSETVVLVGKISPEKMAAYYQAADLFVFSSQSETQGMVLLEAMAGKCPVVCIRSSGTDDVVLNGFNGFKTLAKTEEWANRVVDMLKDDQFRRTISDNALTTAEQYSIEALAKKLEGFYYDLIAQKGSKQNEMD